MFLEEEGAPTEEPTHLLLSEYRGDDSMAKAKKVNKAFVEAFLKAHGYPEKGSMPKEDLQKFYKHCTDEELVGWLELEGLTVTPTDSAPILRMRQCMAILYHHYPKAPSAKKKSKYADYSLEQLVELASTHDVPVEVCDDERILRMRVIMALRAHKHLE